MQSVLLFVSMFLSAAAPAQPGAVVSSPDGEINGTVTVDAAGLTLSVAMNGQRLFDKCPLGLLLPEGESLGPDLQILDTRTARHDESWKPVWGTDSPVLDRHEQLEIDLAGKGIDAPALTLILRAYDDGIVFRYRVHGDAPVEIMDELTAFRLAEDATAFALPLDGFGTGYEARYKIGPLSSLFDAKVIALPITLSFSDNKWAAVTEAHLDDYAGMYLSLKPQSLSADETSVDKISPKTRMALAPIPNTLYTRLSRRGGQPAVKRTAPFETPWRVILLGRRPGDLIESNMVVNCNPPCAIEDPSWIKPGKVMWEWWSKKMVNGVDFEGGVNTETYLHYAAFAAEHGIEYLLMDEGWSWWENIKDDQGRPRRVTDITRSVPAVDLPRILEFCHARGVKVWLWLTWGHCANQMAEAFPLYEKWGIAGVKVDFMNRDDQWMVNWYHEVAELAAKHHLMVNMHGAYKNTGIRRTWPNMLTREGVMGAEHSKWSSNVTPEHNVTIPFTRMLAGPMDYTPGGFNVTTPERFKHRDSAPFVMGTLCHQLAQYVIFESPLQTCADYPERYRGQVGFEFLRWVPTTWDDSRVIDGHPSEFIVMARKRGDAWYIGAMTNRESRAVQVPLTFLGDGPYRLDLFADGPRAKEVPEQIRRARKTVTNADTLEIAMAPSGGYAARLLPQGTRLATGQRIRHLVAFSFKPAVSEVKQREVLAASDRLPDQIPFILGYERGGNVHARGMNHGLDHALLLTFSSMERVSDYVSHPAHQAFADKYRDLFADLLVIDWPTNQE